MPQIRSFEYLQSISECRLETAETDVAISEAETEYAMTGRLLDSRSAFVSLKNKYFTMHTIYSIFYLTKPIYCAIISLLLNFV